MTETKSYALFGFLLGGCIVLALAVLLFLAISHECKNCITPPRAQYLERQAKYWNSDAHRLYHQSSQEYNLLGRDYLQITNLQNQVENLKEGSSFKESHDRRTR